MECSRCKTFVHFEGRKNTIHDPILGYITHLTCTSCHLDIAIEQNGIWKNVNDIISRTDELNGWLQGTSTEDRLVHYLLSQQHNPDAGSYECLYSLPDVTDLIKILWINGEAIGFYTMKPKGTFHEGLLTSYAMDTLDTAYICKPYRRRGYGISLLQDITRQLEKKENLGISQPISTSMWKVLHKFLQLCPEWHDRIWEVTGVGGEGDCKLVSFSLRQNRNKGGNNYGNK